MLEDEICAAYPVESDLSMAGILNITLFESASTESDAEAGDSAEAGTENTETEQVKE